MTDHDDDPVVLDASVDPDPELGDHPLEVTAEEHDAGQALWEAIDDTDDNDNGLDEPGRRTASPERAEAARRAAIVKKCLLEAGVPEVSIELQDGRPGSGDTWNLLHPVSVFSHHIASHPTVSNPTPGLSLVKRGRSDLPGPLANGTAGVDLVYRILTLGMANHPGTGGPLTLRGPMGTYTIPRDTARAYAWGTEFEGGFTNAVWDATYTNRRTGKKMTYREFMGRVNAGLTRAIWLINGHGKTPGAAGEKDLSGYHGEHKTWAPGRKPDRKDYTTDSGRAEIRRFATQQEDDVTAADVWGFLIKPRTSKDAKPVRASTLLSQAHRFAHDARRNAGAASANSAAALRQAKANREAIRVLADSLDDEATKVTVLGIIGPDLDDPVVRPEDVEDPPEDEGDAEA